MNRKMISILICTIFITTTTSAVIEKGNEIDNYILTMDYPEDFTLSVYSGGYNTWNTLYLFYLDATGEASYYVQNEEQRLDGDFELVNQFVLTDNELTELWELILENDFFNLDQEYARDHVVDGSYANLEITGDGQTHSVQTVNIDLDSFDSIVTFINTLTPDENDLYYNALYNNPPLKPGTPIGPQDGNIDTDYEYITTCFDMDDDPIYVLFDWGDGSDANWEGPFNSGDEITIHKSWNNQGSFNIRVKSIDDPNNDGDVSDGKESGWSDTLQVSMPKNKLKDLLFFISYIEKFLFRFPHLKQILDPFGFHDQELKVVSKSDSESGTTAERNGCEITIEIKITFWGPWIDKATDNEISIVETKVENDIENKWNKDKWPNSDEPWRVHCDFWCDFWDPGCTVKFDAIIDHQKNVNASDVPTGGNAQEGKGGSHWIEAIDPNTPVENSHVNAWDDQLPEPNNGMETTGQFNTNDFAGVYAHEAGHLMGLGDQQTESETTGPNGQTVKHKHPNKKNPDGTWNIMAWPGGLPGQDDIDKIVASSGVGCPCLCCEYPWVFFIDDFEDPLKNWTIIEYDPSTAPWKQEEYGKDFYEPPGEGLFYMEADSKEAGDTAVVDVGLFTPALDLSGFNKVYLEFDRNFQDTSGNSRVAICMYSGGLEESMFEEFLLEITVSDPIDGTHTVLSFDPSKYKDPSEVYINFYYTDGGVTSEKFCIDNVVIGAK